MLSEKWDKFKNVFLTVSNICAPFETRRLKNRNNPWIDNTIVRLMYKRDHLKRKAVKYKSDELWESYKQIRNTVTELIISSKKKLFWLQAKINFTNMRPGAEVWSLSRSAC